MSVAIAGVGETAFSRRSGRSPVELAAEAIRHALHDAGLECSAIDGFVTEGMLTAGSAPVDEVARALGLTERPFSAAVSNAGAGLVAAPQVARLALEAGIATTIVTYYSSSLSSTTGGPYAFHAENAWKREFEMPAGWYGQPVYFAGVAQRYEHAFGLHPEHLGAVACAARDYATRTPGAILDTPLDLEDYLAQPMISTPLRRPDCCLTNDGAVAYVMTTLPRGRDLRQPPIVVRGVGLETSPVGGAEYFTQRPDLLTLSANRAATEALGVAGVGIADIDLAEVYDCFSITTLLQLEDLGIAERGTAGEYVAEIGIGPDSPLPVNTHGGLLAHSYMLGGSHLVEAVRQLRGERGPGQIPGAEVALVGALGIPDYACAVLGVDR